MSTINIAFGVTEDWLEYSFITMCSILSNCDKNYDYKFFILSNISEEKYAKTYEKFSIKLSQIFPFFIEYIKLETSDFENIVHDERVGISAYFRLKLSSKTTVNKLIYLDSDLILKNDISKLWNINLGTNFLGAVEDKYSALMTQKANLNDNDTYYNSGVLLMNLEEFRNSNLEEKIFQKLKEPNNDYSDQDVLNDLCRGRILSLPLKYNLMLPPDDPNSFPKRKREYNDALKNPWILHYSIKPWILPVQYSEHWREYKERLN